MSNSFLEKYKAMKIKTNYHLFVYSILWLILTSCASQGIRSKPDISNLPKNTLSTLQNESDKNNYWWTVRFKFTWPENSQKVDFSDNLIVAHQIIYPLLKEYRNQISLWRFHRRAA